MAKSNQITLNKRIDKVIELLLKGNCRADIIQYASKYWKITDRQTDTYIAKANKELENTFLKKLELNYVKAEKRFEVILKKSLEKGDLKTALASIKEIASLQGLYKLQIEQSGEIIFINNIPD